MVIQLHQNKAQMALCALTRASFIEIQQNNARQGPLPVLSSQGWTHRVLARTRLYQSDCTAQGCGHNAVSSLRGQGCRMATPQCAPLGSVATALNVQVGIMHVAAWMLSLATVTELCMNALLAATLTCCAACSSLLLLLIAACT